MSYEIKMGLIRGLCPLGHQKRATKVTKWAKGLNLLKQICALPYKSR